MNISPARQTRAKIHGTIGTIAGLIFALILLFYNGLWYFSIVIFFAIFLQVIQYIGLKQELKGMIEIETEIQLNEINKSMEVK